MPTEQDNEIGTDAPSEADVVRRAVLAEREACAAIADELSNSASDHEAGAALSIAEKIRARGE